MASKAKKLDFTNCAYGTVNDDFQVPIPKGYHYSSDTSVIGDTRQFVVVPEKYSLTDDPMEAPMALSILSPAFPCGREFEPDNFDAYITVFTDTIQIFDSALRVFPIRPRMGFAAAYQSYYSSDDLSWNKVQGVIFAGSSAYIFHFIFNHKAKDGNDMSVIESFLNVVDDWLDRFRRPGENEYVSYGRTTPAEELYPHYLHLKNKDQEYGGLGIQVVVNAGGTEYAFLPFRNEIDDEDTEEEARAVYKRIVAKDAGNGYTLHDTAKTMQALFHVSPLVFDPKHDRECELDHGLMHRAYMMSALRSFVWTVADYCAAKDVTVSDLDYETIQSIIEFIASRDWLNYDGSSHCKGLCGCSDLHVYYVPDGVSAADKKWLLPTQEHIAQVKALKKKFPTYREILSEVHSLDALRDDLEFIFPAICVLYEQLRKSRNTRNPLISNEADILYAWCALAMAAKEPFYVEDGPTTNFFHQLPGSSSFPSIGTPPAKTPAAPKEAGKTLRPQSEAPAAAVPEKPAKPRKARKSPPQNAVLLPEKYMRSGSLRRLGDYSDVPPVIILPDELTFAGINAFEGCTSLQAIYMATNIREDVRFCFENCPSVQEIHLPEIIEGDATFYFVNCVSLREIHLPEIIKGDAKLIFSDCPALQEVCLLETIEGDAELSFNNCTALREIHLPETIEGKADFSFENCTALLKLLFSNSYKIPGDIFFDGCTALQELYLPDGAWCIGYPALKSCTALRKVHLPDNYDGYGCDFFSGSAALQEIHFSDSLDRIAYGNFKDCSSLREIRLPEGLKTIELGAFKDCSSLQKISLPDGLTEIEARAFEGCTSLLEIRLPDGITEIDYDAFKGCTSLQEVFLPDGLEIIETGAFEGCASLWGIQLPDGLKEISSNAFKDCISLQEVHLPENAEVIGSGSFSGCTSLQEIFLPDGLKEISYQAFKDCISLQEVHLPEDAEVIGSGAFSGCTSLQDIRLPDRIKLIGAETFAGCTSLRDVYFPDGLERIKDEAFLRCPNLKNIYLPASLNEIGKKAFPKRGVTLHVVEGSNAEVYAKENGYKYVFQKPEDAAERLAQFKAREEARHKAAEEAKLKAEEEVRRKAEEEARLKAEEEAQRRAEEEARRKAEEEARRKSEEEARIKAEEERLRKEALARAISAAQQEKDALLASLEDLKLEEQRLQSVIREQQDIIKTNSGLFSFGKAAQRRKEAQSKLEATESSLSDNRSKQTSLSQQIEAKDKELKNLASMN